MYLTAALLPLLALCSAASSADERGGSKLSYSSAKDDAVRFFSDLSLLRLGQSVDVAQYPSLNAPRFSSLVMDLARKLYRPLLLEEYEPFSVAAKRIFDGIPLMTDFNHQFRAFIKLPKGVNGQTKRSYYEDVVRFLPLFADENNWPHLLNNFALIKDHLEYLPKIFHAFDEYSLRAQFCAYDALPDGDDKYEVAKYIPGVQQRPDYNCEGFEFPTPIQLFVYRQGQSEAGDQHNSFDSDTSRQSSVDPEPTEQPQAANEPALSMIAEEKEEESANGNEDAQNVDMDETELPKDDAKQVAIIVEQQQQHPEQESEKKSAKEEPSESGEEDRKQDEEEQSQSSQSGSESDSESSDEVQELTGQVEKIQAHSAEGSHKEESPRSPPRSPRGGEKPSTSKAASRAVSGHSLDSWVLVSSHVSFSAEEENRQPEQKANNENTDEAKDKEDAELPAHEETKKAANESIKDDTKELVEGEVIVKRSPTPEKQSETENEKEDEEPRALSEPVEESEKTSMAMEDIPMEDISRAPSIEAENKEKTVIRAVVKPSKIVLEAKKSTSKSASSGSLEKKAPINRSNLWNQSSSAKEPEYDQYGRLIVRVKPSKMFSSSKDD